MDKSKKGKHHVVHDYRTRFDLRSGLIVTVYDTGSVLVQGRIRSFGYYDSLPPIRNILPIDSVWQFLRNRK